MPTAPVSRESASLANFLQILRLRRALIGLILALVLITTLAVTAFLPKWYRSSISIRIEKPESEVKLFQPAVPGSFDPYYLQDQLKIIESQEVLYPVIQKLDLDRRIPAMREQSGSYPTDATYAYLVAKMVRIESPRVSSIVRIDVDAQDPRLAADIANEIARTYSAQRVAFATSEQREGLKHLQEQLADQEKVVSLQRDRVEKIRKDLSISGVDLNTHYSDMEIETLRQMQNTLIALSVDAIGRKTRWEQFKAIPPEERLKLVNSELIPDQNIQNLLQAYLVADQKVVQLKARLGPAHPDLVAAIENRAEIKQQLESQLSGYEHALEIAYKEAEARVAELKKQLAAAKVDQILSARERMRPFEDAAQKLDDDTRMLTSLKLTLRQREIDFQVPKKTIEILNDAEPARVPISPSWPLNITFAVLFGGVLAVGVAVLIECFDTSFRTVGDVESKLGVPVIGVIPFAREPLGAAGGDEDPAEIEPFRVLHTNLNLTLEQGRTHAVVISSAGPGEGKSTTLIRLARLMGRTGERVVLVDSDLRRPTQHRLANRPKEPGLSDFLSGRSALDEVIQKGISPGLDFIAGGSVNGFALSLLYANRLRELISTLKSRYDRIIFDSPPIIGVSDATVLVSASDAVVLLIQYRRNPQSMVMRAQQIITGLESRLVGIVLNQVPANAGGDYGYYTNNYAYYHRGRAKSERGRGKAPGAGDRLSLNEDERD